MNTVTDHNTVAGFVQSLVATHILTEGVAVRLLAATSATGHAFDRVVVELGLMREDALARALAHYLGLDFVDQPILTVDRDTALAIGLDFLSARAILPSAAQYGVVQAGAAHGLILANPFDQDAVAMISYRTEQRYVLAIATRSALESALAALHLENSEPGHGDLAVDPNASESDLEKLRDFAQQAPIVRLVTRLAQIAADDHATDIHIEPLEHHVRVRMRVDGVLRVIETVPAPYLPGISTRLKILANLDISERRLPQDGRIRIFVRGQAIDMRVSVIPSIHGETIVLRLLDRSAVALDLESLGFDETARTSLARLAKIPNGILLITGPTGSGKTTTLYALMSILNDPSVKIFTVEDPVEYQLDGITQLQTNTASGMTFGRALRSVLRQDPDIILVGEIRDRETAEIAMQAALTGHLVLSTLHTNSAVGAITRLRDMGIEDYLIGATLKGIVGQRLLRKSCSCGGQAQNVACAECGGSGYAGRTVTHEIIECRDALCRLISAGAREQTIHDHLRENGMVSMQSHALSLVRDGITTAVEVARSVSLEDRTPT